MATTTKVSYSSANSITVTINSLASNAARQSAVVDNSSTLYLDALLGGEFGTGSGTLSTPAYLNVYVYAITDGVSYSGSASGSDAAYTLNTYKNCSLLATIYINTAGTLEYMSPRSVASCFGGILPQKWGVIIENQTGVGLASAGAGGVYFVGVSLTNG